MCACVYARAEKIIQLANSLWPSALDSWRLTPESNHRRALVFPPIFVSCSLAPLDCVVLGENGRSVYLWFMLWTCRVLFSFFFFVWSARSEEHLSISVESFPVDRAKIRGISSSCLIVRRTVSGLRNGSTMGIVLRVFVGLHCFPCIDRQTNSPPSCRSFIYLSCPISTSDSWTLFQKRCV